MLCAVVFVAANLGVSAARTWRWYRGVFGERAVAGMYSILLLDMWDKLMEPIMDREEEDGSVGLLSLVWFFVVFWGGGWK